MAQLRQLGLRLLADDGAKEAWRALCRVSVVPAVRALVEDHAGHPQARQVLLDLIGDAFVSEHLPEAPRERHLLFMPYMLPEIKAELSRELRAELVRKVREAVLAQSSANAAEAEARRLFAQHLTAAVEGLLRDGKAETGGAAETLAAVLAQSLQGDGFGLPLADPCSNWRGSRTGALQRAGLVQDPEAWAEDCRQDRADLLGRCRGRSLPLAMRRYVLAAVLYDARHEADCGADLARGRPERCAQAQADGALCASESKISNLVSRLLDQACATTLSTWCDADGGAAKRSERKERAASLLNQYYVMTAHHHASLASLLFPLLVDMEGDPRGSDLALLAMLERLRSLLPPRTDLVPVARRVWVRVQSCDAELAGSIQALMDAFRARSRLAADAALWRGSGESELEPHSLVLPWVENVLVGALRPDAVRFVWMHCLLGPAQRGERAWDAAAFEGACASIFCGLKEQLSAVQSVSELHRAVREQPQQLRTSQVRAMVVQGASVV